MDKNQILKEITTIFADILDDEELVLTPSTVATDVEGWDSLSHVLLVVAVEKHFKIRFSSKEIQSWKNIGELIESVAVKI